MAIPAKDTIYIDIDDEITGIIDKLGASEGRVVALVLPKRATVLQSIVNMRLLKRASDEAKKHVVLITSEAGLLPLAGVAGMYVAKTLNSKPEVPNAPSTDDDEEETVEEPGEGEDVSEATAVAGAGSMAVGTLAGLPPNDEMETVELDDDSSPDDADDKPLAKPLKAAKLKKNKQLHIPNFERFRLLLVLGVLVLILLIVGGIFAADVLPKATIDITTDATNVNADLNLNLSTAANTLNTANNTVPATLAQQQKTFTQQVTTTGQQNNGSKATGKVTLSLNDCSQSQVTIPAGTGVSSGSQTFITQEGASLSSVEIGNKCRNSDFPTFSTATVDVTAQAAGASYNLAAGNYTVSGVSGVTASGTAMSGGTDNIVQVVAQADIDSAKSKISTNDSTVKQALENQLQGQGLYAINATFSAGTPATTTSANVGDTANSVTVTETITYTMFGVHQDDLKTLIDQSVKSQIDSSKQGILTEGLDTATFNIQNSNSTSAQLSMQATATAGPQLDIATIKQQTAGQKSGDVKSLLEQNPDVTNVDVKLSPFWVTSVPKKTSKVTVNIAKPTKTVNSANGNNP